MQTASSNQATAPPHLPPPVPARSLKPARVGAFGSGRAMLRRSCKTSRTVTTPPTLLSHLFATVLQLVHDGLFRSSPYAATRRPGGPPVCSGLAHGAETRALVVTEGHCCCALAAQAFCARSSGWSRCSCSRPWPSVHFSCAPLLLNTHVTRTHLRTAPSTTLCNPVQVLRPGARGRNPHALAAAAVLLHLDRLPFRLLHAQGLAPDQPPLPRRLHGAWPQGRPGAATRPRAAPSRRHCRRRS